MKVRLLCICVLSVLTILLAAGCENEVITEEQRPILIPSDGNGFVPGQPPAEQGFPPPIIQDLPDQNTAPSQLPKIGNGSNIATPGMTETFALPAPQLQNTVSLEETFANSKSVKRYTDTPLTISDVSQLLWAGQGIIEGKEETTPSTIPANTLQLYLVAGDVAGLDSGSYLYIASDHELAKIISGDMRELLGITSTDIEKSPVYIILTADIEKIDGRMGNARENLVYLEGGQIAQNISLQATALGLGTAVVTGFMAEQVENITGIPENLEIICIIPVGHVE